MDRLHLGVDLGGTKIEVIALDTKGREQFRRRSPTPVGNYTQTVTVIRDMVLECEQQSGAENSTIGIGTPGAVSNVSGRIKNANSTCLNGRPLRQDLERALKRSVVIANDADCFALSEAADGAGAGAAIVFAVILGTGVGAGIVVNGRLLSGPNAITGEWGHNSLPWPEEDERPGADCYCGLNGCIETFLSGPGWSQQYSALTGNCIGAEAIVSQAEAGDVLSRACLQRYSDRLARALASVMNVLDPDVIVLGGGLSNCLYLYRAVPQLWGRYVFSDRVDTRLLQAEHGDSSGVRGAAWLGAK